MVRQLPAQIILQHHEVPALCYHNIKPSLEGHHPDYTTSAGEFRSHMKMLADSGYTSILPEQLYNYYTKGAPLPIKPILISFDDSKEEQFSVAKPILEHFHFKAVFFIMSVTKGKPGYMTEAQIKLLSDSGNCIALHTWDHPDVRKLEDQDWRRQLDQPKAQLEKITGKPVEYFAYPYGAWNITAIDELARRHVKAAFQLGGESSITHPLYTIRRLQVSGSWSAATLLANIRSAFRKS